MTIQKNAKKALQGMWVPRAYGHTDEERGIDIHIALIRDNTSLRYRAKQLMEPMVESRAVVEITKMIDDGLDLRYFGAAPSGSGLAFARQQSERFVYAPEPYWMKLDTPHDGLLVIMDGYRMTAYNKEKHFESTPKFLYEPGMNRLAWLQSAENRDVARRIAHDQLRYVGSIIAERREEKDGLLKGWEMDEPMLCRDATSKLTKAFGKGEGAKLLEAYKDMLDEGVAEVRLEAKMLRALDELAQLYQKEIQEV